MKKGWEKILIISIGQLAFGNLRDRNANLAKADMGPSFFGSSLAIWFFIHTSLFKAVMLHDIAIRASAFK